MRRAPMASDGVHGGQNPLPQQKGPPEKSDGPYESPAQDAGAGKLEFVAERHAVSARWHERAANGAAGRNREAARIDQFIGDVADPEVGRKTVIRVTVHHIGIQLDIAILRQAIIIELRMVLLAPIGKVGAQPDLAAIAKANVIGRVQVEAPSWPQVNAAAAMRLEREKRRTDARLVLTDILPEKAERWVACSLVGTAGA